MRRSDIDMIRLKECNPEAYENLLKLAARISKRGKLIRKWGSDHGSAGTVREKPGADARVGESNHPRRSG